MVKIINNYTLTQQIGKGNYGQVFRATHPKKPGEYAVKIIPIQKFHQNEMLQECTLNEIQTLKMIGPSEYIVKYEEQFVSKNNYYLVYEFCNGGNLEDQIKKQGYFQQKKALMVLWQLLEAFKVLNRFNIMHRDIKPQNIFCSNGKYKLGDFGFCKGLKNGQIMAKTMLGSPIYMAPEILKGEHYTIKADVWSLGVLLYQMLFGKTPYNSNKLQNLIHIISTEEVTFPIDKYDISNKTLNLLKKMLTKDYFRRISWIELFKYYKIDEYGNYVEKDHLYTEESPRTNNKSVASYKEDNQYCSAIFKKLDRKPSSLPKSKPNYYSEKFMKLLKLNESNDKKINTNHQIQDSTNSHKISQKIVPQFKEDDSLSDGINTQNIQSQENEVVSSTNLKLSYRQQKRKRLINKHEECFKQIQESLKKLQTRQISALSQAYYTLLNVTDKLLQIKQQISSSETHLFDIEGIVHSEGLMLERPMIELKNQLLRKKIQLPTRMSLISLRTLESERTSDLEYVHISPFIKEAYPTTSMNIIE